MVIRMFLMSLVAGLAMEAPDGGSPTRAVEIIAQPCLLTADARMPEGVEAFATTPASSRPAMIEVVDLSGLPALPSATETIDVSQAVPTVTPSAPMIEVCELDGVFEVVVDGMADAFAREVAPIATAEPEPAMVETEVGANLDLDPALMTVPGYGTDQADDAEVSADVPQIDRLTRALRLSGHAVDAWADLLR